MTNKVIVSILIVLLIIAGGLGYYSYHLNRQIDRMDDKLTELEAGQTAQISTITDKIGELQEETRSSFTDLEVQLGNTDSAVGALDEKITASDVLISGLEDKTTSLSSNITDLVGRIENTERNLSGSVIDASEVFETVSRVTVRITDGRTIVGSGFIYDTGGHVITAYHVIRDLSPIYVIMDDGRVSKASIPGYSELSDVAVLQLESIQITRSPLIGDSGKLKIGEPVVTVGSPGDSSQALGLKDTLTAGVISQLNRYVAVDGNWAANMIQFDAPVNFGNSGGPLANSSGEIIGLITARIDPTLGDGIYYAVASNKFKRVADAIINTGYFPYPWVGVNIRNISPEEVQEKALDNINGVLVSDVFSESPAQEAGILPGDIIIAEDGVAVNDVDELVSHLAEFKSPGEEVLLTIIRGSLKLEISVIVGTRPE